MAWNSSLGMRSIIIAGVASLSFLSLLTLNRAAQAQQWPTKPIRIIEPFPVGIARDAATRLVAEKLAVVLGQPVYVENRPGAAGRLAAQAAVSAAPDGYTFNMMGTTDILTKHLYSLPYDIERDLAPVSMVQTTPGAVVTRASLPVKNVAELINYAKAKPGELTYGSTGPGGFFHVNALLFSSITGTSFRHIPYARGNLTADLLGGQIDIIFDAVPPYIENTKAEKLRMLAVTGEKHVIPLPDVPTFVESGIPAYDTYALAGMFAPKNTPQAIVLKMQQALTKILQDASLREQWTNEGITPVPSTSDEFAVRFHNESERWGRIIRLNDIKIE